VRGDAKGFYGVFDHRLVTFDIRQVCKYVLCTLISVNIKLAIYLEEGDSPRKRHLTGMQPCMRPTLRPTCGTAGINVSRVSKSLGTNGGGQWLRLGHEEPFLLVLSVNMMVQTRIVVGESLWEACGNLWKKTG
jgi:hypothetical protein